LVKNIFPQFTFLFLFLPFVQGSLFRLFVHSCSFCLPCLIIKMIEVSLVFELWVRRFWGGKSRCGWERASSYLSSDSVCIEYFYTSRPRHSSPRRNSYDGYYHEERRQPVPRLPAPDYNYGGHREKRKKPSLRVEQTPSSYERGVWIHVEQSETLSSTTSLPLTLVCCSFPIPSPISRLHAQPQVKPS
jgi:hypothetical protein